MDQGEKKGLEKLSCKERENEGENLILVEMKIGTQPS